jgi:hypothetical protein
MDTVTAILPLCSDRIALVLSDIFLISNNYGRMLRYTLVFVLISWYTDRYEDFGNKVHFRDCQNKPRFAEAEQLGEAATLPWLWKHAQ